MVQVRRLGAGATTRRSAAQVGRLVIQAKESAVSKLVKGLTDVIGEGFLPKGVAATLRGTAGWTGSLAAGRCGRIGLEILKNKQYGADQYLWEDDIADLKFLRGMVRFLPPKEVLLYTPELWPLLLYTDASYEPRDGCNTRSGVGAH